MRCSRRAPPATTSCSCRTGRPRRSSRNAGRRTFTFPAPPCAPLWMQSAVPRMLAESGADLGVFPNYAAPLASPCPTLVVVHDLAVLRVPHFFTARKRFLSRPDDEPRGRDFAGHRDRVGGVAARHRRAPRPALASASRSCPARPIRRAARPQPEEVAAVRARHGLERPYVLTVGTLEPRKDLADPAARVRPPGRRDRPRARRGGRPRLEGSAPRAGSRGSQRGTARSLARLRERVRPRGALHGGRSLRLRAHARGLRAPAARGDGVRLARHRGGRCRRCARWPAAPPASSPAETTRRLRAPSPRPCATPGRPSAYGAEGLRRARQFSWTATAEALWARARATGTGAPPGVAGGLAPEDASRFPALVSAAARARRARVGAARNGRLRRPLRIAAAAARRR